MPPMLERGDAVLTRFPFTGLTGASVRPGLIVSQGPVGEDVVLIAVSSVIRGARAPSDYILSMTHPEFGLTGLRLESVFRTHKLVAVERSVIVRRLGRVGLQLQAEVDLRLRAVLGL